MDEAKIKEVLGESLAEDGHLRSLGVAYISYWPRNDEVTLDGDFTAEQLEAIAAHMRAHGSAP